MSSQDSSLNRCAISLAVSDQSQLPALRDWMRGQQDVEVVLDPGTSAPGEQGALDVLTLVASSSGVITAIKVLPEFIRSRRSSFRIEATVRGEKLTLDANNVDDVLPIVDRLLGE